MKLIVVCEAPADHQLASCLIVRSLRQHGPQWLEDLSEIAEFRGWSNTARTYFALWKEIHADYDRKGGRPLVGRRRGPYSIPPTKAILLAQLEPDLDGLVLMVDLDREGEERRQAFLRVKREAGDQRFAIVLATPHPEREAWVLHGFEPSTPEERERLEARTRSLGFDPRTEPERLRGNVRRAETQRDIKKVLADLVGDDRERESLCWEQTPLNLLEERGDATYLKHFLEEIRGALLPRFAGGAGTAP